jgi:Transcriptional regulators
MPPKKTASSNEQLSKGTLRKAIREYIVAQISNGSYQPGDRIVETQLAKELNVSQAPVREALLELGTMGILEDRPYSGTFVRSLKADDIEDIYNTRAFIDEYAARLAAKRITDEQLLQMEQLVDKMDHETDISVFVEEDIAFHEMVLIAARSPSLKRIWDSLRLVEWTALSAAVTHISLHDLAQQHREIYTFLKEHADHSAGAYMFIHIKNFGDEMKRYFAENEDTASRFPSYKQGE